MKSMVFIFCFGIILAACKKTVITPVFQPPTGVHPQMKYFDLADATIPFDHLINLDLDGDAHTDIRFGTLLVGDPINQQDEKQWLLSGAFDTYFPINASESIPLMRLADNMPIGNFAGYNWYNAASIILAQKIIGINNPPYWLGDWKEAIHRYVPLQLKKAGALYNGWVEVSFSMNNEKLTLHRAAICLEANKAIQAGK